MFILDECDKMLDEAGKYAHYFINSGFRYERTSSKDFHEWKFTKQISNDVLCNLNGQVQRGLQDVHERSF
jgi:hypothetical protein